MSIRNTRFKEWVYPKIIDGIPTKYNWIVQNIEKFQLGFKTDIGAFTYINAKHGVFIDDFVQIGSHCSIYSLSTIDSTYGEVKLLKNCKVGSHSTILPGVTIGENTIVGAHSLVNKNLPANKIAFGTPVRIMDIIK